MITSRVFSITTSFSLSIRSFPVSLQKENPGKKENPAK
jgi:hypothetical protein